MHYYVDLREHHFAGDQDPLTQWYADPSECTNEFAERTIRPDVMRWLAQSTPRRYHICSYVIPFVSFKALVGFERASDAALFKLAWL